MHLAKLFLCVNPLLFETFCEDDTRAKYDQMLRALDPALLPPPPKPHRAPPLVNFGLRTGNLVVSFSRVSAPNPIPPETKCWKHAIQFLQQESQTTSKKVCWPLGHVLFLKFMLLHAIWWSVSPFELLATEEESEVKALSEYNLFIIYLILKINI